MTELHPIFSDCCADDSSNRYALMRPFVRNGHVYATDGKIVVRQPSDDANTEGTPRADEMQWDPESYEVHGLPLPALDDVELAVECSNCLGSGRKICPTCKQEGDCQECEGTGMTIPPVGPVDPVNGIYLRSNYVRLLWSHGVREVFPRVKVGATRPLRFMLGNIEGLVMPMGEPKRSE